MFVVCSNSSFMDLAMAINTQSSTSLDINLWELSSSRSGHSATKEACRLDDALSLCAKMANLAFSSSAEPASEVWHDLYHQFQNLRNPQQQEGLLPLLQTQIGRMNFLELGPHSSSANIPYDFPLQIHTSRAHFYLSFLYHLTSSFFLMSKPRNIDYATNNKLETTTWHAVQICSLSMSNNILWSWDPVVVAALLHSGRSLSYGAQQDELLRHLRLLEETTMWKIGSEIDRLENFYKASS